jgi:hypothetical protein
LTAPAEIRNHTSEGLMPEASHAFPTDPTSCEGVAREAFLALHDYLQHNHYKGYEFDDLLGSRLVRALAFNNLLLQRVAVQIGQLCPAPIRPMLGVRKLESAKARGFSAKGYLYYYLLAKDQNWLMAAEESLAWLLCNHATGYVGISWGNEFDFASRGGFFRKGLPTIVWTSHIAQTFELAYAITGEQKYLETILQAGEFIANALERHQDRGGTCFAYAPGRLNLVYNSNLLGAAALIRCWKHTGDDSYFELANSAYRWTISQMNADGSWYYGLGKNYRWIDNFHTAYNLECLLAGFDIGGEAVVPFRVVQQTYEFWIHNFFLSDGTPKYYHDRMYPLDIQCGSQAIETLSNVSRYFPAALEMADKVVIWTIKNLQKSNGAFRYQLRRFWKNNLESIHWGQSTMLSAIGTYLYLSAGTRNRSSLRESEPEDRTLT